MIERIYQRGTQKENNEKLKNNVETNLDRNYIKINDKDKDNSSKKGYKQTKKERGTRA